MSRYFNCLRWLIYLALSAISALCYLFVPFFNLSTKQLISNYAMFMWQNRQLDMVVNTLIFSGSIFIALAFLFGYKKSSNK